MKSGALVGMGGLCAVWGVVTCKTGYILPCIKTSVDTYNAVQTLAGLFVIVGVVVAVAQYVISSKARIEEIQARNDLIIREKTLKAIEITGFFKDQVLDKLPIINMIHCFLGINEILKKVDANEMKKFNLDELLVRFSSQEIDMVDEKLKSSKLPEIAQKINIIFNYCLIGNSGITGEPESEEQCDSLLDTMYRKAYQILIIQTMNNIEYFAMYYINDSANEKITYRSWHGLYLETMKTLYYEICLANKPDNEDTICVDAIALYNKWNERANQERAKQQSSC